MTPIDPPPGLLDKVAEAQWNRAMAGDPDTPYPSWSEAQPWDRDWNLDLARAAWDAMAEGLGLERRYALREDDGTIWLNDHDTGEPLDSPDREWVESIRGGEELVTRLVSKWEPQP